MQVFEWELTFFQNDAPSSKMWRALLGSVASFASWLDQNGVALCNATLRFRAFHIQNVLAPLLS